TTYATPSSWRCRAKYRPLRANIVVARRRGDRLPIGPMSRDIPFAAGTFLEEPDGRKTEWFPGPGGAPVPGAVRGRLPGARAAGGARGAASAGLRERRRPVGRRARDPGGGGGPPHLRPPERWHDRLLGGQLVRPAQQPERGRLHPAE